MAWSTLGLGWKLKMPLSRVPYQLSGGMVAGPGEDLRQVDAQCAAVEEPAQRDGREQSEGGSEHRLCAVARRLDGGPYEQRRLQALTADREECGGDQRAGADGQGFVQLALQLGPEVPGGAAHPEDHPGDQPDGHDGQGAAERLLCLEGQLGGAELQYRADGQAQADGDAHAEPDRRQFAAVVGLDEVGDEDADHEAGFQALAQADQIVGEHAGLLAKIVKIVRCRFRGGC